MEDGRGEVSPKLIHINRELRSGSSPLRKALAWRSILKSEEHSLYTCRAVLMGKMGSENIWKAR